MLPTTISIPQSHHVQRKNERLHTSCPDFNASASLDDTASTQTTSDHFLERSGTSLFTKPDDVVIREEFCLAVRTALDEQGALLKQARQSVRSLGNRVMSIERDQKAARSNFKAKALDNMYHESMSSVISIEEKVAKLEDLQLRASWSRGEFPIDAFQHSFCAVLSGMDDMDEFLVVEPIEI